MNTEDNDFGDYRLRSAKNSFRGVFCDTIRLMKTPKCKICGGPHYAYMCFQNPKRKYAIKRKYSGYKQGVKPKKDKLLRDEKSLNRRKLILELDKYCSWIVRLKASDKYGVITCYTCGKRVPYKMAHCCHYISRRYGGTRFDFDNLRAGCEYCNVALHGNLEEYRTRLISDIGINKVRDLEMKKNRKISTPELSELLSKLKKEYKELLAQKKSLIN